MRSWERDDPDLGWPIAAPLERCAELLGTDLTAVRKVAGKVEPYIRADGTKVWSLMQLTRQLRPKAFGPRRLATTSNGVVPMQPTPERYQEVAYGAAGELEQNR